VPEPVPAVLPSVSDRVGALGEVRIERMRPGHWPAVRAIYATGIATGIATFERETPEWEAWDAGHRPDSRLVAVDGDRVLGWVALSPYSERRAYAGVAWLSVYVAPDARGRGVGRSLVEAAVEASETAGAWTLLVGIQAENTASLALFRHAGFRRIGVQQRIGQDASGRWRDVVLMERRSSALGR
jgi:L-amino acid N-acyltransferase YncA